MAEELCEDEGTCKTERHGEQYGQRQQIALILCGEDQIDEDEAEDEDHTCRTARLLLRSGQTRILVGVAVGQRLLGHFFHSLDGLARGIAVGSRGVDGDGGEEVESVDAGRTVGSLQRDELVDGRHAVVGAYIDIVELVDRHAALGTTLYIDTVELTEGVEVAGVLTTEVARHRGEDGLGRRTGLLGLGHVDVDHILRIVRVVGGHGSLDLLALTQRLEELLRHVVELVEVATRAVLHREGQTVGSRESGHHRRREGQDLCTFDGGCLLIDHTQHGVGRTRIDKQSCDTRTREHGLDAVYHTPLTLVKRFQLDDEGGLVGTGTSDEVVTCNHLTTLDPRVGGQHGVDLLANLQRLVLAR